MTPEHIAGLEKALVHSGATHTLRDVLDKIVSGDAQAWESEGAVLITELRETPQMRVLHFWLAAGELEDVISLSEKVIEWGRGVGCKRASLSGRRGWEKVLAPVGWTPELVLMGRNIENGQGQHTNDITDC